MPRTIYLLSLCSGYQFICASSLITVSALIGLDLTPDKRLATLPLALQYVSIMLASVPASLLMGRVGRKAGFLIAGCIGLCGASLALFAVLQHQFVVYCIASLCFGTFTAFANYYRFTAADVVPSERKSRAISWVMAGGLIAAFIGPNLATWSANWFAAERFAGPFVVLMGVYALSMITISFAHLPEPATQSIDATRRPIMQIVTQPTFMIATLCQMFGYGIMNLVMTSTPLAMHAMDFDLSATATVIQWHVVAMFAPSFFTGALIKRFGIVSILLAGVIAGLLCVGINLTGTTHLHFISALVALGISWNFLFVGGTTLVTETYQPAEKSRAQAANDFLVFSTVSLTALTAGTLHHVYGWERVNLSVLPILLATGCAVGWLALRRHRNVAVA